MIDLEINKREEVVSAQLDAQIARFDKESKDHKRLHRRLRYAIFILSGCSTLAAGFALANPGDKRNYDLLVVGLTVAIGLVTSIEGLRKPSELWIHERSTYYALQDLKRELDYRRVAERSVDLTDEIFCRMQSVLEASGDKWNRQIVGHHPAAHDAQKSNPADTNQKT